MSGNYSLHDLRARIDQAAAANRCYIDGCLAAYARGRVRREELRLPVLAFCGNSRAGKDEAAKYLAGIIPTLVYPGSVSEVVAPLIAAAAEQAEAFDTRHEHREFWVEACNELRRDDPTLLIRMTLGVGDVVAGIRGKVELAQALHGGIIDLAVWVDNPRVKPDFTVAYGPGDCDMSIYNRASLEAYHARLDRLARCVYPRARTSE